MHARTIAVRSTLVLGLAVKATAQATSGTLVASNMTTGTAQLIDAATGQSLAVFPTAVAPHEVAISRDGRWAVVAEYGDRNGVGKSLLVLDVERGVVARRLEIASLPRPHGLAFLPGDRELVVTSEVNGVLGIVDFASGAVTGTIETGGQTSHMVAVTPDGRVAATTNLRSGSVSIFDLATRSRRAVYPVGTAVEGIAVTPDGREVWAGANSAKQVIIVDAASGKTAAIEGFGFAYRIAITPDGRTAVVTDPGNEQVHLVDVAGRTIRTSIPVAAVGGQPASPQGVTLLPDGRTAVVTLKGANQAILIDLATARVVQTVTTQGGSDGIGFSVVRGARPK
jgi:DNA-binding beta-propeller fold protein YncE